MFERIRVGVAAVGIAVGVAGFVAWVVGLNQGWSLGVVSIVLALVGGISISARILKSAFNVGEHHASFIAEYMAGLQFLGIEPGEMAECAHLLWRLEEAGKLTQSEASSIRDACEHLSRDETDMILRDYMKSKVQKRQSKLGKAFGDLIKSEYQNLEKMKTILGERLWMLYQGRFGRIVLEDVMGLLIGGLARAPFSSEIEALKGASAAAIATSLRELTRHE